MWIAIDLAYGKKIAYAGIAGEEVIFVYTTHYTGEKAIREVQAYVKDALRFGNVIEGIITEKPYHKANAEVFRQFAEMNGQFKQFCDDYGMEFVQVMPAHWKKSYFTRVSVRVNSKPGQAHLNKIAERYIGRNNFTPDERDAVLMGLYVVRRKLSEVRK